MIRAALVTCAFLLAGAASLHLYRDTRSLLRAPESIPALLAGQHAGAPGVFIVMQPEDCLGSGELVARWNGLHRAGRFPVTGLVVGSGDLSPRQRILFEQNGAAFPLRAVAAQDAGSIAEKLGYVSTPFAVVLDKHGRVAGSFPGLQNVSPEVLERLINGTAGISTHVGWLPRAAGSRRPRGLVASASRGLKPAAGSATSPVSAPLTRRRTGLHLLAWAMPGARI